jgi:hypothetical protein
MKWPAEMTNDARKQFNPVRHSGGTVYQKDV